MDFNINNETFANAYRCLSDANILLEAGLGNFNELDESALGLVGKSGISNVDRLNNSIKNCSEIKDKMYTTIKTLADINVESAEYFQDYFDSYNVDFDNLVGVDYGSEEHLAYVRQFARNRYDQNVGPSGFESWCPLNVGTIVRNMETKYGYTDVSWKIREDGVKVFSGTTPDGEKLEDLVIIAADVKNIPNPNGTFERGQIVDTSLGTGIVVDLCEEAVNLRKSGGPVLFDIYAAWWEDSHKSIVYGKK